MAQRYRRLWIAILLLALLAGCSAAPVAPERSVALALTDCRLSAPGASPVTYAAECGTLEVPEDRSAPGGAVIGLRVVLLPAISRDAAADPLFLLAGGPGQAASEAFTPLLPALDAVRQRRDLVLVDQRGTGGSNPLSCPLEASGLDDASLTPGSPQAEAWWQACLAGLAGDATQYTTDASADDLDAVRAALGYEQVNLLGVSYGTRLALSYLRRHPERVRALVLDGVVPPEMAVGATMARDGQRALDLIFAGCAADQACAAAFPNPKGDLTALLARLETDAPTVSLADPFTNGPTELLLTRDTAAATIHGMSYAPETAALIPLLVHQAQQGDLRPLAAQALITSRQLSEQVALGLRASVLCSEDAPRYPATGTAEGYLGDLMTRSLGSACAVWPRAAVDAAATEPVRSEVPTLLLSGERDPVTPPANGASLAAGMPNSLHLVAPGQGHNVFFRGCLPTLVAEFLAAGGGAALDTSCVARLGPQPFFTSYTGPQP